jgi:hypothetical protein
MWRRNTMVQHAYAGPPILYHQFSRSTMQTPTRYGRSRRITIPPPLHVFRMASDYRPFHHVFDVCTWVLMYISTTSMTYMLSRCMQMGFNHNFKQRSRWMIKMETFERQQVWGRVGQTYTKVNLLFVALIYSHNKQLYFRVIMPFSRCNIPNCIL